MVYNSRGQCTTVAGLVCRHCSVECDSGFRMQNHTFGGGGAVQEEHLFINLLMLVA